MSDLSSQGPPASPATAPATGAGAAPPAGRDVDWQHRVVVLVLSLVVAVLAWLVAAAFLPRWWSHRVGSVVGDSITTGVIFGVFCGFVFTFLPLMVLRLAVRRRRSGRFRLALLAITVLLSVPNLLTLWIVLGTSNAAHAGERTLDVQGTGFRGASAAGAIGGVALFAAVAWVLRSRRRLRAREAQLRTERADLKQRLDRYETGERPGG